MRMTRLQCDLCGGSLVMDDSGEYATCESCGMKFKRETIKKMIVELSGPVLVEGIANVEGLLARAREFEQAKDWDKAIEYYNRILDLDPNNAEAKERYAFFTKPYAVGEIIPATITSLSGDTYSRIPVELPNHKKVWIRSEEFGESLIRLFGTGKLQIADVGDVVQVTIKEIYGDGSIAWNLTEDERQRFKKKMEEKNRRKEEESLRDEEKRRYEQSRRWEQQGLCKYCGAKDFTVFGHKCKSCGRAN